MASECTISKMEIAFYYGYERVQCMWCGATENERTIDREHIIEKGVRPDLVNDIKNLGLLCQMPCHHLKTIKVIGWCKCHKLTFQQIKVYDKIRFGHYDCNKEFEPVNVERTRKNIKKYGDAL